MSCIFNVFFFFNKTVILAQMKGRVMFLILKTYSIYMYFEINTRRG